MIDWVDGERLAMWMISLIVNMADWCMNALLLSMCVGGRRMVYYAIMIMMFMFMVGGSGGGAYVVRVGTPTFCPTPETIF